MDGLRKSGSLRESRQYPARFSLGKKEEEMHKKQGQAASEEPFLGNKSHQSLTVRKSLQQIQKFIRSAEEECI